jgi:hypothetical protein
MICGDGIDSRCNMDFKDDPTISDNINRLSELHFTHYTRYPQEPTAKVLNVPELSDIADSTIDHLILAFTQSINPRS